MPQNTGYTKRTRSAAVNKMFPGKSRSAGVNEAHRGVPMPKMRPAMDMGKKPKKGVLRTGGGHG